MTERNVVVQTSAQAGGSGVDRRHPVWARGVGVGAGLVAVLATVHYATAPWRGRAEETATYPYVNSAMTDFRDTVMLPARAMDRGINPYDIPAYTQVFGHAQEFNPYAPWWLSATRPFASLDWSHATLAFAILLAVLTTALAAVAGAVAARRLPVAGGSVRAPWVLAAVSALWIWVWRPTSIGQGLGNVGAVAALAALLVLMLPGSRWGAVMLAVAWVKPQFGIPLVIMLLIRKEWRQAVGGTLLAVVLSVPAVVRLSSIAGGFPELLESVLSAATWVGERAGGEPFMGRVDLAGLLEALGLGVGSLLPMALGAVLVAAAAGGSVCLDRAGRPALGVLLMGAALLVSFPHLHYDLPLLAPVVPWVVLEARAHHRGEGWWSDAGMWFGLQLVPVGLASDHLLPQAFPVSRLGGVVSLVCVIGLMVLAVRARSAGRPVPPSGQVAPAG